MSKSFIEGKWYLYKHSTNDFYLRCSKNSINTLHYSEWISPKEFSSPFYGKTNGSNYNNDFVTDIEVSIDKVKEFLPINHPDLQIESIIKDTKYLIKILKKLNIK